MDRRFMLVGTLVTVLVSASVGAALSPAGVVNAQQPRQLRQLKRVDPGVRPIVAYASFDWYGAIGDALRAAERQMRAAGLKVDAQKGWERIGIADRVSVVVTCAPTGGRKTRIVVVARSTNTSTAESTRNQVIRLIKETPAPATPGRVD
jgi:hypothetical protein